MAALLDLRLELQFCISACISSSLHLTATQRVFLHTRLPNPVIEEIENGSRLLSEAEACELTTMSLR